MDEQDLQGGEVDDRIPILQLDPERKKQNKIQIEIEKDGFKTGLGSRLD